MTMINNITNINLRSDQKLHIFIEVVDEVVVLKVNEVVVLKIEIR